MNAPLHLDFLATGGNQHVFEDRASDGEWVFKIPAAFGRILPWNHVRRLARAEPRNPAYRVIYRAFFAPDGERRDSASVEPVHFTARIWSRYIERNAARRFDRMLRIMDALSRAGGGDLLLPYSIETRPAMLHVDDRVVPYAGPLLRQRRAVFRRVTDVIRQERWEELVRAQYRLWQFGVAVADVIRYTSWVVDGGVPRIADADSLTMRFSHARSYVSPSVLDRERTLVRRIARQEGADGDVEYYLAFMSSRIHADALADHWPRATARSLAALQGTASW